MRQNRDLSRKVNCSFTVVLRTLRKKTVLLVNVTGKCTHVEERSEVPSSHHLKKIRHDGLETYM